jgi:thymidylate kinase
VTEISIDRSAQLIDLLGRISSKGGPAVVWKNVEAGVSGEGDLDVMAPRSAWEEIERSFRQWAAEQHFGAVAVCHHVPGTMYLIALDPFERIFLQLDVKDRATFRGATVFETESLEDLWEADARGFRRLSPGAEGLFKLVINGISDGGRPDENNLAKERVAELLVGDEQGYRRAAARLGSIGEAAAAGAQAVVSGGWNRRAMAKVESHYLLRAVREPRQALSRLVARRAKKTCPIIKASLRAGRRVPEDVNGWVDLVAETHAVYKDEDGAPERQEGPGAVLSVVGPDGSGKTTLIDALLQGALAGRPIMRLRKVGTLPRRTMPGITVTEPHKNPPYPFGLSYLKTAYVFCDYFLGWWLRIRPFVKSGGWVIVERGWWDIAVDPRRYRMSTPSRLLWALGRLQPLPDLLLILEAPAEVVYARKKELTMEELDRQMRAWRKHLPAKQKHLFIDATRPVDEVVAAGEAEVERLGKEPPVPEPQEPAVPRFVLPLSPAPAARAGLRIYHPMTARGLAGWNGARLLAGMGLARLLPVGASVPDEVASALAPYLREGMRLAVAATNHPGRYVALGLHSDGSCEWVAKVASGPEGEAALAAEAKAVRELSGLVVAPLSPPRLLQEAPGLLQFAGVEWKARLRPWYLPQAVAAAAGSLFAAGAEHGDFAPWNLYKTHSGWALLDWEEARRDPSPYLDLLHFLVQGHALLGRPAKGELLRGLSGRGWIGRAVIAYADAAGLAETRALDHLPAYLKQSAELLDENLEDGRRGIGARRALLAELGS